MYDLKLTLHKYHFAQTCEFMEGFEKTVKTLAENKALCSIETYNDRAVIYISSLQSHTLLNLLCVAKVEVERGNYDQYANADMDTLTNYFSEEHATELVLSKLKNNRLFIKGEIVTTHKVEITKELLEQFDWDNKTYDQRQVLIDHLLPSVTGTQRYMRIGIVSGDADDIDSYDLASATIDELFGPYATDFW